METPTGIRNADGAGHIGAFHALVLAAGAGRRFGGGKLSALWRGRPLLSWAIEAARAAPVETVTVLVQPGFPVEPAPGLRRLEVVDWREGMAASLRAGIAALPPCAGAFVFLGDMPAIPKAVLPRLAEAVRRGALAALPEQDGMDGHPVLLSSALFAEIGGLQGDRGARSVLERLGDRRVRVSTDDPGVRYDIDTPDDLAGFASTD